MIEKCPVCGAELVVLDDRELRTAQPPAPIPQASKKSQGNPKPPKTKKNFKPLEVVSLAFDPWTGQPCGFGVDKDGRVWYRANLLGMDSQWMEVPQPSEEVVQ